MESLMDVSTYFTDFLNNIRLTRNQIEDCQRGHRTLRKRLMEDEALSPIIVSTFLQGSYRRATAVRPKDGKRADVDVIVVTTIDRGGYTARRAIDRFVPFCEKHYGGKFRVQGRSIGIELGYVDLDVVPTAIPPEGQRDVFAKESVTTDNTPDDVQDWLLVDSWVALESRGSSTADALLKRAHNETEWKLSPLYIPDREVEAWVPTHPLEQIRWTFAKNKACNGHYVNVVKALKWWRRLNPLPEYPKGYPVEHMIGQTCPDGIRSVGEGVAATLEAMVREYGPWVQKGDKPFLADHGVPQHDVLKRVAAGDFASFYSLAAGAARMAREALDAGTVRASVLKWRKIFGDMFPLAPDDDDDRGGGSGPGGSHSAGGFTPRSEPTTISGRRFA
jgi:Second Messenger Oligonucleotide or Dinucleotide Synthetase domain